MAKALPFITSLLCIISLFGFVETAKAVEIRVIGDYGLVRAKREVPGSQAVVVAVLATGDTANVTLQSAAGAPFAGETRREGKRIIFRGVSGGTWKIAGASKRLLRVKIQPRK